MNVFTGSLIRTRCPAQPNTKIRSGGEPFLIAVTLQIWGSVCIQFWSPCPRRFQQMPRVAPMRSSQQATGWTSAVVVLI
eukprot:tig00000203_g17131.t1